MRRRVWFWIGLLAVVTVTAGCAAAGRPGQASSYLIVESFEAASGAEPQRLRATLASDVVTIVERRVDGETTRVPTVYADLGVATFRLAMKDPNAAISPANFITLQRYRVTFRRSDGRNTPGVDVPWAFDGALTQTVGTGTASVEFTLVRVQAKSEAPLMALAGGGGAITISTMAEVTFWGTDQAGREVVATASISVHFADWGDPQ